MEIDTHQPILSTISSYNIEQLLNIHPRLCILHKWSHYDGIKIFISKIQIKLFLYFRLWSSFNL